VASFAKSPGFVANLEGALRAAGAEERAAASDCLRVLFATGQHNDGLAARAVHEGLLDAMLAMLAESGADYSGARRATTANLVAALKSLGQNAAHADQVSFCKHFSPPNRTHAQVAAIVDRAEAFQEFKAQRHDLFLARDVNKGALTSQRRCRIA